VDTPVFIGRGEIFVTPVVKHLARAADACHCASVMCSAPLTKSKAVAFAVRKRV
jgi:hypothetical protein